MLQNLLDAVFPRKSLQGEIGTFVTPMELRQLQGFPRVLEKLELQNRGMKNLDRVVAAASYESSPLLRRAVYTLKYGKVRGLAEPLARLLHNGLSHLHVEEGSVLCPVPLFWMRRFDRGFNQSMMLAIHLSKESRLPVVSLLKRVRGTGFQARRTRVERRRALKGAFRLTPTLTPIPTSVILIDDVCTSGATLDACAETLRAHGVTRVQALTLALG